MTPKRMAHVTDTHLGQRLAVGDNACNRIRYEDAPDENKDRLRLVLEDVSRRGITHIVFGGDIGAPTSVGSFFALLKEYQFTSSMVLGNHDVHSAVARYHDVGASPVEETMCSSHDDGSLKQIILDSSQNRIGDRQLTWLAGELLEATKVALFSHHPILAVDTPVERSGVALQDRDQVQSLLARSGCDVTIFCGHYHMIDEAHDANIRQFVTPAVSYQIVKQSDRVRVDAGAFGYRILDIDGTSIRTETVLLA